MKLKTMFYRTSKLFRNETTCHILRNKFFLKNAWLSEVDKNSSRVTYKFTKTSKL